MSAAKRLFFVDPVCANPALQDANGMTADNKKILAILRQNP